MRFVNFQILDQGQQRAPRRRDVRRIDAAQRAQKRREWNPAVLWPFALLLVLVAAFTAPAIGAYRRRERMAARG